MAGIDLDLVRHALQIARKNGFAQVELQSGESHFSALLDPKGAPKPTPTGTTSVAEPEGPQFTPIKTTSVGYYQTAKEPLSVGQQISKGQVVGTIRALGLSYDIESPASGVITELLIEEGHPVMYGQVIAQIEVSS